MFISQVSITEFRKMKTTEIKEMQSVAVMADGDVLFFAIIPPLNAGMTITDNIRTQAEYLALRGNTVGGKVPDCAVPV